MHESNLTCHQIRSSRRCTTGELSEWSDKILLKGSKIIIPETHQFNLHIRDIKESSNPFLYFVRKFGSKQCKQQLKQQFETASCVKFHPTKHHKHLRKPHKHLRSLYECLNYLLLRGSRLVQILDIQTL